MTCKCKPIYAKRDTEAQGSHYTKHVCHMTGEGLHDKSEIAAELAHRDIEIERLRGLVLRIQKTEDQSWESCDSISIYCLDALKEQP